VDLDDRTVELVIACGVAGGGDLVAGTIIAMGRFVRGDRATAAM